MMTDREIMQMALDALDQITPDWRTSIDKHEQLNNSTEALRTALAEPKKEWSGLTRNDVCETWSVIERQGDVMHEIQRFARAIEAKLKEKNT